MVERRFPGSRAHGQALNSSAAPRKFIARKRPVGRPPSYREAFADQAYKMRLLGLTVVNIADLLNISIPTLYEWLDKVPEFKEAWDKGGLQADGEVVHSLFQRAKGYEHKAERIFMFKGGIIRAPYIERYPPDTPAAERWLYNRQPGFWKNRSTVAITGSDGGPLLPPVIIINPVRAIQIEPRPVIDGDEVYEEGNDASTPVGHGDD